MQQPSPLPLGLNLKQLAHYQKMFNLSNHLNYLEVCRQRIPLVDGWPMARLVAGSCQER